MSSNRLPFELWREIFLIVFTFKSDISHPPSEAKWLLSPLHTRVNIYRCLARVCKLWRNNARPVFFEDIQALTAEAVKGIMEILHFDKDLARTVTRISFSFYDFRCSKGTLRKPRPLAAIADRRQEHSRFLFRRGGDSNYSPNVTNQASHWNTWQSQVSYIIQICTSISDVSISFTSDQSMAGERRTSQNYRTLFPIPNLNNKQILEALVSLRNLRKVVLIDPSPLEQYGPAMAVWERLHTFEIVINNSIEELEDTAFIPPRNLSAFTFHDWSRCKIPWPLASDLGRCTNLQYLNLGASTLLANPVTVQAITFLVSAYQGTLVELVLDFRTQSYRQHEVHDGISQVEDGVNNMFRDILNVQFEKLETLRILLGTPLSSAVFYGMRIPHGTLKILRLCMLGNWKDADKEEMWKQFLSLPCLKGLKTLQTDRMEPARQGVLEQVCKESDVELICDHEYSSLHSRVRGQEWLD